ncbi:MAG: amidase family protein [Gemmatimonas sp.]
MAAKRLAIREHLASLLTGDTVLLMPTAPDVAPQRGLPPKETVAVRERMLALLCPAGLGGLPQLSLPLAQVDGLPVGLSLLAAPGKDEALLACARLIHGAHHTP